MIPIEAHDVHERQPSLPKGGSPMHVRRTLFTLALALASGASAGRASSRAAADTPAAPAAIALGRGSSLWLEGSSNLHRFESKTTDLALAVTRDAAAPDVSDAPSLETLVRSSGVSGLDLDIPVTSLHSERKGLDKNMYKALRADENPTIHFHLAKYSLHPRAAGGDTLDVSAEGALRVAGRERPVALSAVLVRTDQGLWLEGSKTLQMTQFGVRPPTMMLGALRVDDHITVRYKLLLAPAGTGGPRSATTPK